MDGRIESECDLGTTNVPFSSTNMMFAPPVSSIYVLVAASRYTFSANPSS